MIRALIIALLPVSATADTVFAKNSIRPNTIITAEDLTLRDVDIAGTLQFAEQAIGQEARVAIYAGRPVRVGDIGPPALVARNELVVLHFKSGALEIVAEGRALDRGSAGELVRVMNLTSRQTVSGRVLQDGSVEVRR